MEYGAADFKGQEHTVSVAVTKIERVYGATCVLRLIRMMQCDERNGGHLQLRGSSVVGFLILVACYFKNLVSDFLSTTQSTSVVTAVACFSMSQNLFCEIGSSRCILK